MTHLITGAYGRAWPHIRPTRPAHEAGLESWIVEAPYAHPVWSQYGLSVIHLRDLPGVPPAERYGPATTHEVVVFALDPAHLRSPEAEEQADPLRPLLPVNFFGQFRAESDEVAVAKLRETVHLVVDGHLSPDTDFRDAWKERFPFHPYGPTRAQYMGGLRP